MRPATRCGTRGDERHLGAAVSCKGHGLGAVGQRIAHAVVVDPVEQRLGILEARVLGGRAQHDGVQKAVAAVARASEGIARRLGVAGLDAAGSLVGAEQTIGGLKVDDLGLAVGARVTVIWADSFDTMERNVSLPMA